ncbi:hypothetical protein ACFQ3K_06675 [Brucella gallinifaecis]|uniref:Uncharacterized protein n=1 Tax=Brucella gallinifaecis TaxID=215590 RepID=A0A502BLY8_9HYPH|nr:hypothetical protein [Brucella gallinifaecis]TPF74348.1 hypothetical protein FHY56_14655 [Brucella gallinifaecis]
MNDQTEQVSLGKLIRRFASSPAGLPALATLCLALIAVVPVVMFQLPRNSQLVRLGLFDNATVSGWTYVGWWLLIPVLAFAAATVTRILPVVGPYRKIADQIAFVTFAGVLVWSFTGGSIGADIRQARDEMRGLMGSRLVDQFRFLIFPYYGAILALVAPALLIAAGLRERPRKLAATSQPKHEDAKEWTSPWGFGAIGLAVIGVGAFGFAIVGLVGFFLFGGVGPNWFRFIMIVFLIIAIGMAATLFLRHVLAAKLNRPSDLKTLIILVTGGGSLGAGIVIGLMATDNYRIGAVRAIIAVLVALIPLGIAIATVIKRRRSQYAG